MAAVDALYASLGSSALGACRSLWGLAALVRGRLTRARSEWCRMCASLCCFVASPSLSSVCSYLLATYRSSACRPSPRCPHRPDPPLDVLVFRFLLSLFVSLASRCRPSRELSALCCLPRCDAMCDARLFGAAMCAPTRCCVCDAPRCASRRGRARFACGFAGVECALPPPPL